MNKKRLLILLLLLVIVLPPSLSGYARVAGTISLDRWVFTSGGGFVDSTGTTLDAPQDANGTLSIYGAIGQGMVGNYAAGVHYLCAGFWCGSDLKNLFLPMVMVDEP